jgi:hypothetical protein
MRVCTCPPNIDLSQLCDCPIHGYEIPEVESEVREVFHCYYDSTVLMFTPKFRHRPSKSAIKPLYPIANLGLICPVCHAEYAIEIEVVQPTHVSLDKLEEFKNKPSR